MEGKFVNAVYKKIPYLAALIISILLLSPVLDIIIRVGLNKTDNFWILIKDYMIPNAHKLWYGWVFLAVILTIPVISCYKLISSYNKQEYQQDKLVSISLIVLNVIFIIFTAVSCKLLIMPYVVFSILGGMVILIFPGRNTGRE